MKIRSAVVELLHANRTEATLVISLIFVGRALKTLHQRDVVHWCISQTRNDYLQSEKKKKSLTLNTRQKKKTNVQLKGYDFQHGTHSADTASSTHVCIQPAENWEPNKHNAVMMRSQEVMNRSSHRLVYKVKRARSAAASNLFKEALYRLLFHINSAHVATNVF